MRDRELQIILSFSDVFMIILLSIFPTSSGPYVITWNFRRVKAGHLYDYRIKKYPDVVVADNFRFGQHKSIVVALPDDVTMVKKANLTKPQGGSSLRDSVVNSPF